MSESSSKYILEFKWLYNPLDYCHSLSWFLARSLGPERFGLYTLAIALVGYASIFDAGLTRAVIREISYFRNKDSEIRKIISNSTIILTLLGVLGGGNIFWFWSHSEFSKS